jgi:hypothetical protein
MLASTRNGSKGCNDSHSSAWGFRTDRCGPSASLARSRRLLSGWTAVRPYPSVHGPTWQSSSASSKATATRSHVRPRQLLPSFARRDHTFTSEQSGRGHAHDDEGSGLPCSSPPSLLQITKRFRPSSRRRRSAIWPSTGSSASRSYTRCRSKEALRFGPCCASREGRSEALANRGSRTLRTRGRLRQSRPGQLQCELPHNAGSAGAAHVGRDSPPTAQDPSGRGPLIG